MTVGMSAPPIGMINSTPKASEIKIISGNSSQAFGKNTNSTPAKMATPNSDKLIAFWPLYVIGRVGMISMSLPAAIRLPVKVRKPRITSATRAPTPNAVIFSGWWQIQR